MRTNNVVPGSFYKRGQFWWYKRQVEKKLIRVSTKLTDINAAIEWVRNGPFGIRTFTTPKAIPQRFVTQLLHQARSRAKIMNVPFKLTADDFQALYEACGKHCAVSGLPFDLAQIDGAQRRPYAPSIDRIDRMFGYTKDNCRLVCCAVNLAMNDFGENVLWDIAASMVELRRKKLKRASVLAN